MGSLRRPQAINLNRSCLDTARGVLYFGLSNQNLLHPYLGSGRDGLPA